MNPKHLIALLAGGEGRRIGGAKPHRLLAGRTLVDRVADRARLWPGELRLVVRDSTQAGDFELPLLFDEPGIEGPLAGLAAALRHAADSGCDAVLTVPCDTPFLPANLAERLAEALALAAVAVAASDGRLHPACATWRTEVLDELAGYLASGRRSLRGFAESVGCVRVEWDAAPFDPFFNVNDAADLAEAQARLR